MGTLTVTEFISVDGVIDSPGGEAGYAHAGWTFDIDPDPTVYGAVSEAYDGVAGLVLGRRTYDGFAAAWPQREGTGDEDAGFAVTLGDLPKYVVSTTLTDPAWRNTTVVPSVAELAALKQDSGPLLVAGSGALVHDLHKAGLVDRWHLLVFPVVLGSGRRLFPADATDKQKLTLTDHRTYANGVQLQVLDAVR
ncbi:MAG TPA: dihydrofolate reductase family protein [Mycobacteriales bacterium]|nr:dihydrofolate reductase family protein [Mycobacteriales bacterium]